MDARHDLVRPPKRLPLRPASLVVERKLVEENPVTGLWKSILDKFPDGAKPKV